MLWKALVLIEALQVLLAVDGGLPRRISAISSPRRGEVQERSMLARYSDAAMFSRELRRVELRVLRGQPLTGLSLNWMMMGYERS